MTQNLYYSVLVPLVILILIEVNVAWAGIASLRDRWPIGHHIRVCFFGGTPSARMSIAQIAAEWTVDSGVSFDFGQSPDYATCDGKPGYDIRVGFAKNGSFWSYLGTQAKKVPPKQPTMNLGTAAK
jgi:hypothetical protein